MNATGVSAAPSGAPQLSHPPVSPAKKFRHLIEYAGVLLLAALLRVLPRALSLSSGRAIGRLFDLFMGSRRAIARANILAALPGTTEAEAGTLIRKSWVNLGEGAAEFVQMSAYVKKFVDGFTDVEGMEHLNASYAKGKGALLVTAHYGAWELGAKVWPYAGFRTAVVARRVKNPWVNGWVTRIREAGGAKVILARDAVRESVRWLKAGGLLAVLIDHRVTEGGLVLPFLGRPAYTTALPAILALRYGVPVHPARCWRDREGNRVQIRVEPAMDFSGLEASDAGVAEATNRMNAVVERWVKERPEAWLWIHNRWKMPPQQRA